VVTCLHCNRHDPLREGHMAIQIRRREFITLLGGAAAAWPLAARAQQQGKLPLVGVLVSASPPHPFADALRRGLQSLGY
jgi:putative tryptophan/tyrosine transport system substrate-binding protein